MKSLSLFAAAAVVLFGFPALAQGFAGQAVISPDLPDEPPARADLDSYGGWTGLKGQVTGFFHVEQLGGRYWLITPEGNAYFMLHMGWAHKDAMARMKSWGFNASEDDSGLPFTVDVKFFRALKRQLPVPSKSVYPPWISFPDVFDPTWPDVCRERAEKEIGPYAKDPMMVGYQLDNEVALDGWYDAVTLTEPDAPARGAFIEVARAYYADKPDDLAKDWAAFNVTKIEDLVGVKGDPPNIPGLKTAWEGAVAERAFSVIAAAAKAVAPNHLNLGPRMFNAPLPSPIILQTMGKYCDVISMNLYSLFADRLMAQLFTMVPAIHAFTGKPTIVSEFSYRGGDTAHPNSMGALPTVKTQAERAIGYMSYVTALASIPTHLGVSWYKYPDDEVNRSWEKYGEDCNFGVVDPNNRPYAVLTQAMRLVNSYIYDIAANPVRSEKCQLFYRTELARWDRPGDEVLFQRLLGMDEPFVDPLAQMLPEPRRWHQHYWIQHRNPNLIINDDRFSGWCEANLVQQDATGTMLALINVQALTLFPRSLWYGAQCEKPEGTVTLWSDAQFLLRRLDASGRLTRLTMADSSFARTEYDKPDLRLDRRTPYLDLQFNQEARELAITSRGDARQLGLAGVNGWKATWNGKALEGAQVTESDPLTVFALPE